MSVSSLLKDGVAEGRVSVSVMVGSTTRAITQPSSHAKQLLGSAFHVKGLYLYVCVCVCVCVVCVCRVLGSMICQCRCVYARVCASVSLICNVSMLGHS